MPIQIASEKDKTFRTPPPSKSLERQFGKQLSKMVAEIGQQFQNETLDELTQKTIDDFEGEQFKDAKPTGNFANVFLKLSEDARRKILKRFSDDRIKKLATQLLDRSDKISSRALYGKVEDEIGISTSDLIKNEQLKPETNALILETTEWIKKLRDDTLQEFTANTLRVMSTGADFETVMKEYRGGVKKQRNHAQFIARNQLQNFNSISSKIKAQNLGVEEAIWRTAKDEDVRPCHKVREGKKFRLDKGLFSSCDGKTLLPGIDFNCRCTYEMIIPEED